MCVGGRGVSMCGVCGGGGIFWYGILRERVIYA